MTPHPDLHAERLHANTAQTALTTAEAPFAVTACPGAGKTRIIVDRHINRAVSARKGRAITSFTRVAAATINLRCQAENRLDLTEHPHFIGTFDTFLWLHLVRPYLQTGRETGSASTHGVTPQPSSEVSLSAKPPSSSPTSTSSQTSTATTPRS